MGVGVRMVFVLYFDQSHSWIWFKIVLWKSQRSIQICRTFLQKNSNILTVVNVSWMAWSRCQFNPKGNRNLLTLMLVYILLWVNDRNGTTLFKWSFETKIVWTKTYRFGAYIHLHLLILNQTWLKHNICFAHPPRNTMNYVRVNFWLSGEAVYQQIFCEHSISRLHMSC